MSNIKNIHWNAKEILQQLQWRYAVKKFDASKKLTDEQWTNLSDALILSASSYGLQPWKFFVIKNPEVRNVLRTHSYNQPQVEEASHFVVFAHLNKLTPNYIQSYIDSIALQRKVDPSSLDGFKKAMLDNLASMSPEQTTLWASRQTYIALGNFLSAAAMMGIDACPMEGFDKKAYDNVLSLQTTNYSSVVVCAVGFRSTEDKLSEQKKVRFAKSEVIQYV